MAGVLPEECDPILSGYRNRFLISVVVDATKVRVAEQTSFCKPVPVPPNPHDRFFDKGQRVATTQTFGVDGYSHPETIAKAIDPTPVTLLARALST